MFGKKEDKQPNNQFKQEIKDILLDGEMIEDTFPLMVDALHITNKRLIFVDNDINNRKTKMYSIAFNKIESVSVETNEKVFALTNTIEIGTKVKTHELKFMRGTDIQTIFKKITSKTV